MPIFNGGQPTDPEDIQNKDDSGEEERRAWGEVEQIITAEDRFLEAAKEGLTEKARETIGVYYDLLQNLADKYKGTDRDLWFCKEIYEIYVKAAKINPAWQVMVDSALEDLETVRSNTQE
jgi:hypothetical protein